MTSATFPVINIQGIKRGNVLIKFAAVCGDSAMSSQTNKTIIDNLQLAYRAVLLQIVRSLEKDQQEQLRFYFKELIKMGDPRALSILSSLENEGKISWTDVSFLKDGLREVGRLDLAKNLTEFEIKRNLTILLDFYARMRQGSRESSIRSALDSVEKVAEYLLIITRDVAQDGFDVSESVRSLVGESRDVKNLMREFEEKCDQELTDPWSKLTLLIVFSCEILAVALAKEEHHQKQEVMRLLFTAAEDLCPRILKLGNWVG